MVFFFKTKISLFAIGAVRVVGCVLAEYVKNESSKYKKWVINFVKKKRIGDEKTRKDERSWFI